MGDFFKKFNFVGFLLLLIFCALLLLVRVVYLYVAAPQRFPINTYKISAKYEHITRAEIERVLARFGNDSFILMSTNKLKNEFSKLAWANEIDVQRVWPDTLKITITEKEPAAYWNDEILTKDGQLIFTNLEDLQRQVQVKFLPQLSGPDDKRKEVLQNYQKLSKLLGEYGLRAVSLNLQPNLSWDMKLSDGVELRLGKMDIERRVQRFCKAYSAVFADRPEQISRVDLRYAHGMA